jgi:hypothetical protein
LLRTLGFGIAGLIGGYVLGAVLGYGAVANFSSNQHDRSVEAAMTACFFFGPVAGLIGLISGILFSRRG